MGDGMDIPFNSPRLLGHLNQKAGPYKTNVDADACALFCEEQNQAKWYFMAMNYFSSHAKKIVLTKG